MRIVLVALVCVTSAFGQGAGQVQFRGCKAPAATAKPKVSCASLRADQLRDFDPQRQDDPRE
jgi:hypothetical protein